MNQITRSAPAQRAVRCPTKRSVNLAKRPPRTRSAVTLVLGVVLITVLALAVAKFAVLDQLARQRASARGALASTSTSYRSARYPGRYALENGFSSR